MLDPELHVDVMQAKRLVLEKAATELAASAGVLAAAIQAAAEPGGVRSCGSNSVAGVPVYHVGSMGWQQAAVQATG